MGYWRKLAHKRKQQRDASERLSVQRLEALLACQGERDRMTSVLEQRTRERDEERANRNSLELERLDQITRCQAIHDERDRLQRELEERTRERDSIMAAYNDARKHVTSLRDDVAALTTERDAAQTRCDSAWAKRSADIERWREVAVRLLYALETERDINRAHASPRTVVELLRSYGYTRAPKWFAEAARLLDECVAGKESLGVELPKL
jgi:hypothetical protein